ncbi:hypothetical protein [Streptomyces erythrochromogenes]|uniref:hypothetical protein n=1 Tax=Streptomyces erythrochromogenes TaxID=285574 RepID=UPI0037FC3580
MRFHLPHAGRVAFRRRYGASPLHLLLVLVSFAIAGYAGVSSSRETLSAWRSGSWERP